MSSLPPAMCSPSRFTPTTGRSSALSSRGGLTSDRITRATSRGFVTALPWEVPDFDVARDIEALLALENKLRRREGIVLTESRYIIEAHKPG